MNLILSILIIFVVFNFNKVQAQGGCEAITSAEGSWFITPNGTRDAVNSKCDFNQIRKCENIKVAGCLFSTQKNCDNSKIVDMPKMPALSCAIQHSQYSAMRRMIDAKADVNGRDESGLTPLMHSAWASPSQGYFTGALISVGADVNAKDKFKRGAVYYAHLLDNAKAEAEIVKENFDKKNPCDFSLENLNRYFFIAQAETQSSTYNYIDQPDSAPKQVGRALLVGFTLGHAQKNWKTFIDKVTPYTSESYYGSNCLAKKNPNSGSSNTSRASQ